MLGMMAHAFVVIFSIGNPDLLTRIPDDIMKAGTKEILKFLHQTESGKTPEPDWPS
jgi:hypothetical protein